MSTSFTITYDYLCPFARIANETLVEALRDGASYDVSFAPFSLYYNSLVEVGDVSVWHRHGDDELGRGVLALLWSIAVRDHVPDLFRTFHLALFSARHDDGEDLSDPAVIRTVAASTGIDTEAVASIVDSGTPLKVLEKEHTGLVESHAVFGVPTFVAGEHAVFVRLMERHRPDDLRRVVDMLDWTNVNEFKRTTVSH